MYLPNPRRVILTQLPLPPVAGGRVEGNVPLAAAYLVAALRRLDVPVEALMLVPETADRAGDGALVDAILATDPDWVGFSCYVWNVARTLHVARALKVVRPDLVVLLGGPEVQSDNDWLAHQAGFDVAVHGEGEQTLVALVQSARGRTATEDVAGLLIPGPQGTLRATEKRAPLVDLAATGAPYREGILDPRRDDMMLVETTRGCRYGCAFCAYAGSRRGRVQRSTDELVADVQLAQQLAIREVYLLDPSLDQHPDFRELVDLLARLNPEARLELFGELRAEAVDGPLAAAMAAAGFREVELGLQTTNRAAERAIRRSNELASFAQGARALKAAGIRARADAIVGLPGDDPASIAATFDFMAEQDLGGDALVFPLAVLPGTELRRRRSALGLVHQPHPPYQVLATPSLGGSDIASAFELAGERFGLDFQPAPRPSLVGATESSEPMLARLRIDLDGPSPPDHWPRRADNVFTLWLRAGDLYARRDAVAASVGQACAANPYGVLHVVLEAAEPPPHDLFDAVAAAWAPPPDHYLEAFHAAVAPPALVSRRAFALLRPEPAALVVSDWAAALPPHVEPVWDLPRGDLATTLATLARLAVPGWHWVRISLPGATSEPELRRLLKAVAEHGPDPSRVVFDDPALDARWLRLVSAVGG